MDWVVIILIGLIVIGVMFWQLSLESIYIIEKGWHYSVHIPRIFAGRYSGFTVNYEFNRSAIYTFDNADQQDINKLFGIAWEGVHKNSVRVGWRWNNAKSVLEIFDYRYTNGVRTHELIRSQSFNGSDKIKGTVTLRFAENVKPRDLLTHILFPYFGGNQTAPHKIKIRLTYKLIK